MDALSDALKAVGLTGGVFLEAQLSAPWCLAGRVSADDCRPYVAEPEILVGFHFIAHGRCFANIEGGEALALEAGDVVMLPRNDFHFLASSPGVPPVPVGPLIQPGQNGALSALTIDGGGEACRLVCGFLSGGPMMRPLLATLPPIISLPLSGMAAGGWIAHTFRFVAKGLAEPGPGSAASLARVSELLFVEVLRHMIATGQCGKTGWLAAISDLHIGKALALIHGQPAFAWTADLLAREAGLSRSVFNARFAALTGQPPMRYLLSWRLQQAARRLRESQMPVARIAAECGYESESTFTRAFRREFGCPPGQWRRGHGGSGGPSITGP